MNKRNQGHDLPVSYVNTILGTWENIERGYGI